MKQNSIEKKLSSHMGATLFQSALLITIITIISLGSVSIAATPGRTKSQPNSEPGEIDTAAATALAIAAFREIQGAMIEADFQRDVRACASSSDRDLAASLTRLAVKRRASRLHKLDGQLTNMETAYNTWADMEKEKSPRPLDMAGAATHLREIATSSPVADLNPQQQRLVASILHPLTAKSEALLALANVRPYSPPTPLASAATVAQFVEVRHSGLSLLAVAAIIAIFRISQLAGLTEGAPAHRLVKRT